MTQPVFSYLLHLFTPSPVDNFHQEQRQTIVVSHFTVKPHRLLALWHNGPDPTRPDPTHLKRNILRPNRLNYPDPFMHPTQSPSLITLSVFCSGLRCIFHGDKRKDGDERRQCLHVCC